MHCHHPDCDCNTVSLERNGKSYCSEACATGVALTKSLQEDRCDCAHEGCGDSDGVPLSERPTVEMRAPGSISTREASDPEGPGLKSDGMVGDTRQRAAESPGHQGDPMDDERATVRRNNAGAMKGASIR